MPTYMNEMLVSEDIRVKVTVTQRAWIEQTALREGLSMNQVVRRLITDAMRALEDIADGGQKARDN